MDHSKYNELLDFLLNTAKSTKEFATAELPLLYKEIITYHIVFNTLWTLFFTIVSGVCFYWLRHFIKKQPYKDCYNYSVEKMCLVVLALLGATLATVFLNDTLQGIVSPRVVVLNYLRHII